MTGTTMTFSPMLRLHLVVNALLLWLGYYWLGIGESSIPNLLWSALVAMALLCLTLIVHGAAYVSGAGVRDALRTSVRHLGALLLLALAALLIYGLLGWWKDYSAEPALKIASWLTLKSRKPVKPAVVLRIFDFALWIVRWVVLPWLLVPLAGALTQGGWRGLRKDLWHCPWRYRIAVPVFLIISLWLPLKLLGWVPHFEAFPVQMLSFVARLVLGYVLFVGGLLALAWATSGGSPRFNHSSTVPSP